MASVPHAVYARNLGATQPEDLDRLCMERGNAGDADVLVALYEPDAVLPFPHGKMTIGRQAIPRVYVQVLTTRPKFQGDTQPASSHHAGTVYGEGNQRYCSYSVRNLLAKPEA